MNRLLSALIAGAFAVVAFSASADDKSPNLTATPKVPTKEEKAAAKQKKAEAQAAAANMTPEEKAAAKKKKNAAKQADLNATTRQGDTSNPADRAAAARANTEASKGTTRVAPGNAPLEKSPKP